MGKIEVVRFFFCWVYMTLTGKSVLTMQFLMCVMRIVLVQVKSLRIRFAQPHGTALKGKNYSL